MIIYIILKSLFSLTISCSAQDSKKEKMMCPFVRILHTILHVLLCVVVSICDGHVTIDHWIGWNSWRIVCVPS